MESSTSQTKLDPEYDERFLSLRRQLGVTGFGINQMLLRPGQRMRIHRHRHQEEVYVILEGTLTIAVEQQEVELSRYDVLGRARRPPSAHQLRP